MQYANSGVDNVCCRFCMLWRSILLVELRPADRLLEFTSSFNAAVKGVLPKAKVAFPPAAVSMRLKWVSKKFPFTISASRAFK